MASRCTNSYLLGTAGPWLLILAVLATHAYASKLQLAELGREIEGELQEGHPVAIGVELDAQHFMLGRVDQIRIIGLTRATSVLGLSRRHKQGSSQENK